MYNYFTVGIWNTGPSTKEGGITIPGILVFVRDIAIDIQPYSKELFIRAYGYSVETNKRIFTDTFDGDIKIGTIFKYTDKYEKPISLEVKAVPWDDEYMEIACFQT